MREIGTMVIPENGAEAFELACKKAKNAYSVERSIAGHFRLYSNGSLIHDDPTCDNVNDEDKAYWFFAELINEKEKSHII